MKSKIEILKGIPPGKIIDRDLKKFNLSQEDLARAIDEHSKTINNILLGQCALTIEMASKIEQVLGYEKGLLSQLQHFYQIIETRNYQKSHSICGVPSIRHALFWDTEFDSLDWGRYRETIIARVMERGNDAEKTEIIRFYKISSSTQETDDIETM